MLRVWLASGQELASLREEDLGDVRALKSHLATIGAWVPLKGSFMLRALKSRLAARGPEYKPILFWGLLNVIIVS